MGPQDALSFFPPSSLDTSSDTSSSPACSQVLSPPVSKLPSPPPILVALGTTARSMLRLVNSTRLTTDLLPERDKRMLTAKFCKLPQFSLPRSLTSTKLPFAVIPSVTHLRIPPAHLSAF